MRSAHGCWQQRGLLCDSRLENRVSGPVDAANKCAFPRVAPAADHGRVLCGKMVEFGGSKGQDRDPPFGSLDGGAGTRLIETDERRESPGLVGWKREPREEFVNQCYARIGPRATTITGSSLVLWCVWALSSPSMLWGVCSHGKKVFGQ